MNEKTQKINIQLVSLKNEGITGYSIKGNTIRIEMDQQTIDTFEQTIKQQRNTDILDVIGEAIYELIKNGCPNQEEIRSEIIHRVHTSKGHLTHGIQYDLGSHKSNIICVFCRDQGKLTTSKTLKKHMQHIIREHSEELGFIQPNNITA